MNIRIACMSLLWRPMPLEQLSTWLDDVVAAGYEGVSVMEDELIAYTDEGDLPRRLADRGLGLASVAWHVEEKWDQLHRVCAIMQQLECTNLVTLGGLARRSRGLSLDEVAGLLERAAEVARPYGLRVGHHNHTADWAESLEECEALLAKLDPEKMGAFLDCGHATKDFAGHPVADRARLGLEKFWDRLFFLEFKDWSPEHDLRTPVGCGATDYQAVFDLLKSRGYSGWIAVEQNGPMGELSRRECAMISRAFIRGGLGI